MLQDTPFFWFFDFLFLLGCSIPGLEWLADATEWAVS